MREKICDIEVWRVNENIGLWIPKEKLAKKDMKQLIALLRNELLEE